MILDSTQPSPPRFGGGGGRGGPSPQMADRTEWAGLEGGAPPPPTTHLSVVSFAQTAYRESVARVTHNGENWLKHV